MSNTIYAANGKPVTFIGTCANEIIPSINRSLVYKAKEGGHVRMVYKSLQRKIIVELYFIPPIKTRHM